MPTGERVSVCHASAIFAKPPAVGAPLQYPTRLTGSISLLSPLRFVVAESSRRAANPSHNLTGATQFFDKLSRKDALARIEREDGGRRRYLKRYFGRDIDDPLDYHLVINTDWVALRRAAAIAGDLALNRRAPESAALAG